MNTENTTLRDLLAERIEQQSADGESDWMSAREVADVVLAAVREAVAERPELLEELGLELVYLSGRATYRLRGQAGNPSINPYKSGVDTRGIPDHGGA